MRKAVVIALGLTVLNATAAAASPVNLTRKAGGTAVFAIAAAGGVRNVSYSWDVRWAKAIVMSAALGGTLHIIELRVSQCGVSRCAGVGHPRAGLTAGAGASAERLVYSQGVTANAWVFKTSTQAAAAAQLEAHAFATAFGPPSSIPVAGDFVNFHKKSLPGFDQGLAQVGRATVWLVMNGMSTSMEARIERAVLSAMANPPH